MIAAYEQNNAGTDAIKLFRRMQTESVEHAGLVEEGRKHFESMIKDYSISPGVEHYACMVDLLGRAGCLLEAYKFIETMPVEPDAGVWGALLSACRIHGNVELAELVVQDLWHLV
ncbi:hypothetical protein Pyn_11677 [Prunus yedoensis var. nudiflora]|uniref:Pentatricopeptide repeat-containing protein n=1 Tax=Prunus yedoensis var. nudiflora TaxID=2094558 RepID=A0A314XS26_PRUYE|nr:hypothetical protein Pyn_11677 [Prunus yedoensis var. nudiflora]